MMRTAKRSVVYLCIGLMGMAAFSSVRADDGLKTISNPGGGQIVFGPMDPQPSVQVAMGKILHLIHGHYGERP
jgi:hypothetical protein